MNIADVNTTIKYYENQNTTLENCRILADLYICKANYIQSHTDSVEDELDDILPRYQHYCDAKRKYQLRELDESTVLNELQLVCSEIQDFIEKLYSCTDTEKERELLRNTCGKLNIALHK